MRSGSAYDLSVENLVRSPAPPCRDSLRHQALEFLLREPGPLAVRCRREILLGCLTPVRPTSPPGEACTLWGRDF